jgi:hypothetical protein
MYTITPGIAALVWLRSPESTQVFVYLSDKKLPVSGADESAADFIALPLSVRAAINQHFGIVFSLPVGQRADYLKNLKPIEIE